MAAITFKTMPVAQPNDPANQPHILGDPADVAWEGMAERINSNFAAFNTWATTVDNMARYTKLTGSAVITPNTGWSLTGGWASALYLTFINGARFVDLAISLVRTSATVVDSGSNGAFAGSGELIGSLAGAILPVSSGLYRMRFNGQLIAGSGGSHRALWCVADGGTLYVLKASGPHTKIVKDSLVRIGASYFTKLS